MYLHWCQRKSRSTIDIVVSTVPTTKEPGMSLRTAVLTTIVAISAVIPVQSASAQNYPTKPIHLIVPYPAGGGTDFFARLVGQKMSELVGQPIVMENKPCPALFGGELALLLRRPGWPSFAPRSTHIGDQFFATLAFLSNVSGFWCLV